MEPGALALWSAPAERSDDGAFGNPHAPPLLHAHQKAVSRCACHRTPKIFTLNMNTPLVLICFAVKEEAKFMRQNADARILVTGMGQKNAAESLRKELALARPELLLTCGFAGGLNPKLKLTDIVFDADSESGLAEKLTGLGAVPARFHFADRVAVTAVEKQSLWQSTGADAVEMESFVMRKICRENKIPSVTVRVISDEAGEDLPLDFNALMTPDCRIDFAKLALKLLSGPQKIPRLMKFQKQTILAARKLAETLETLLSAR
ncbi:MAG: phosphorylase [Pedosphaera sp.]|nr:phosphorylase [Pedosphaera sp.]